MLRRILALLAKELAGLWKDRKTRFVILIPPLVQVILFAYAATYDVKDVALGIWNEDAGAQGAELVRRFAGSPAFHAAATPESPAQAATAIDAKQVAAVLHVAQNFSADILAGRHAQVQLLIDARRSNTALMVQGYATAIVAAYAADLSSGQSVPVAVLTRDWFNPNLESQWFILPGLVSVLSMMMAMLVSALSLARERELGTLEQLLVTPLRPVEILVGKALPGIIVGWIDANIVIAAALLWFRVPFLGDMALLQGMLIVYMLAGVAIGLVISSIARTQQQAMLGVFVIASPMVVLSGYAAPVENMPAIVAFIGQADPIRWMLIITRGLFLQDLPASLVLANAWPLVVIGSVAFSVAWLAVRRAVS
ncbi:MAG: ABC transporter permease [Rhodopila sp.]|jgi:ABC-2 type transport system permease protein